MAAGDRVLFRPVENSQPREGMILRIEPRHGTISRAVRGRRHVLVSNVDQLLIVASVAEPRLKPNLIDRFLVAAENGHVRPIICINKIDLVEPANLEPLVGVYSRMGYPVLLVSAKTGFGTDRLRRLAAGRESVVAGQSGVGKSSLLNAIDTNLHLRIGAVSEENEKGQHTTTTARLLPLGCGGFVVDTPGMRQFRAVGRDSRGGRRLFPRPAALREPLPVSQLHAHPRGRLRGEGRRDRRPPGRTALRELLPPAERTDGGIAVRRRSSLSKFAGQPGKPDVCTQWRSDCMRPQSRLGHYRGRPAKTPVNEDSAKFPDLWRNQAAVNEIRRTESVVSESAILVGVFLAERDRTDRASRWRNWKGWPRPPARRSWAS